MIDKEHVYDGFLSFEFQSQSAQHIDECRPRGILRLPRSRNDGAPVHTLHTVQTRKSGLVYDWKFQMGRACANFTRSAIEWQDAGSKKLIGLSAHSSTS